MAIVNVIIPNYNHSKYLEQRIDSVLNQSFKDFSVIILDDFSTDNSLEILLKYKNNPAVKSLVTSKQNSGNTFKQWIKGFGLLDQDCKYVWIAESDDFSDLSFLAKAIKVLENGFGVFFCGSNWVNETSEIIHKPSFEEEEVFWKGYSLIQNEFIKGNFIYNASTAVFERNLLKNINFNILCSFSYVGDWYFWLNLIKETKVFRAGERLNFFRRHSQNVSSLADKNGLQIIEGWQVVRPIIEKMPLFKKVYFYLFWAKKIAYFKRNNKIQLTKLPVSLKVLSHFFWFLK